MKNNLMVLLFLATIVSCTENKVNDLKKFGLKGNVKSYYEKSMDGNIEPRFWGGNYYFDEKKQKYFFNKNGMVDSFLFYSNENKVDLKSVSKYSKDEIFTKTYRYNNGKVIDQNSSTSKTIKKSDREEKLWFSQDGAFQYKTIYYYQVNNIQKVEFFTKNGSSQTIYKLNQNGDVVTVEIKDETGKITTKQKFRYLKFDNQGNWTKMEKTYSLNNKKRKEYVIRTFTYY